MEQELKKEEPKEKEKPEKIIPLRKMILEKYPNFFKELNSNLKLFAREIRKDLREEGHVVIGVTGYPGRGKSNDTSVCAAMIDEHYSFEKNICFIPTAKEISDLYLSLPMYSVLHIDEASKSMHKHKWHERVQQKLNELYDSVSKDNEIIFYDGEELKIMPIEKMYSIYGDKPKNLSVYVIDDKFSVSLKKVNKILQRPIRKPQKKMFKIKTELNRETIVTEDHSLFMLKNRGEKIEEISPKDLKKGDKLISPLIIPLLENIEEDNSFMQLCGAWLADGNYRKEDSVQLSGKEHSLIMKEVSIKFKNRLASSYNVYNKVDYVFSNRKLVKKMKDCGFVGNSHNKIIPSWVFNTTKENKISFLKGYFMGDGSINRDGRCRASSINYFLLRQMQIILNSLGLVSRIFKSRVKNSYNNKKGRYQYYLDIPTMFHKTYIKFFDINKKNYEILKKFVPSKGFMVSKRKKKYIKGDSICLAIKNIEEVKNYEGHVYDLSIEGVHRFLSNDILHKNTDREGHFLCTFLLMPRFNNFTENFRNFMIKYWIDIPRKGLMVFYVKDEDKDVKDPWHMDESYKMKKSKWRGKRVFERSIGERIGVEQKTECYWFYCEVPAIPEDIWEEYQMLKKQSRIDAREKEPEMDAENHRDRQQREKFEKWETATKLKNQGLTMEQIGAVMKVSGRTVKVYFREMRAYSELVEGKVSVGNKESNIIFNRLDNDTSMGEDEEFNKI